MEAIQPILARFAEVERLLTEQASQGPSPAYTALLKEHARLTKVVDRWRIIEEIRRKIADAKAAFEDPELREMAQAEVKELEGRDQALTTELENLLLEDDAAGVSSIILEVRPGTGGEEASLFAFDLYRMYLRYVQRRGWKHELLDLSPSDLGGVRSATMLIDHEDAYRRLRFESGPHRVQRVPKTETAGRIHTSVATVAVLPETDDDITVEIRKEDLRVDTYSAGGPGGQHVNKTASAIRITHLPSGIIVACQEERSQVRNREKAMRWLKARLIDKMRTDQKNKIDTMRRDQVGTGDRSEKIRTYNVPQSRVTDHRVHFSVHNLESYLDGDLDAMIDTLLDHDRAARRRQKAP